MNVENNQQEINKVSEFETEQQDDNVSNGQQQQQSDMVSQENDVTPKKSDQFLPSLNNSNFNIVYLLYFVYAIEVKNCSFCMQKSSQL